MRYFGQHETNKPVKMDEGDGPPIHAADRGTLYWDYTNKALYVNNNGSTGWKKD